MEICKEDYIVVENQNGIVLIYDLLESDNYSISIQEDNLLLESSTKKIKFLNIGYRYISKVIQLRKITIIGITMDFIGDIYEIPLKA